MTFTHIVTFTWNGADADTAGIAAALRSLAGRLDGVRSYLCGPDAGLAPSAADFAVVGTFDNREYFTAYRDHPEHQRILNDMILPHLGTRTVVQWEH